MIRVGFCILNYKNYNDTLSCLLSLNTAVSGRKPIVHIHVCVVDNYYDEITIQSLECAIYESNFIFTINLIKNSDNLGYGRGNNIGLKYLFENIEVDFAFVVNSDIKFDKCDLTALHLLEPSTIVCLAAQIKEPGDERYLKGIESFNPITFKSQVNSSFNFFLDPIPYVSGAFFGFSSGLYNAIGGFTEYNFLYFEELDFFCHYSKKYNSNKLEILRLTNIMVSHSIGGSTGNSSNPSLKSDVAEYYSARSRVSFTKKYLPKLVISAVVYNILLCLHRLIKKNPHNSFIIIKATINGLLNETGPVNISWRQ